MGKLILDKLYNRKGTDCVKWDHKDFVDSRVSDTALPLWLSDMEFKVADEITEALIKRVEHGFLGHSMPGDSYLNLFKDGIKDDSIGPFQKIPSFIRRVFCLHWVLS